MRHLTYKYITGTMFPDYKLKDDFSLFTNSEDVKNAFHKDYGTGPDNPKGLQLSYQVEGKKLILDKSFEDYFMGPPGYLHGGVISAVCDDIMGGVVFMAYDGTYYYSARITVHFLQPVALARPIRAESWLVRQEGRKCYAESIILDCENTILVEAEGLFIRPRDH